MEIVVKMFEIVFEISVCEFRFSSGLILIFLIWKGPGGRKEGFLQFS